MAYRFLFLFLLLISACGKDGNDGHDGNSPEPIPGQPGDDAITEKRLCKLTWDIAGAPAGRSYEATYNVLFYKGDIKLASLAVYYKTAQGSLLDESKSILWGKDQNPQAPVDLALWTGRLSPDLSAFELFRKPTVELRGAACTK